MNAKSRYDFLRANRDDFLAVAIQASALTLPYLIKNDDDTSDHKKLRQPWQSIGAKATVALASKLMLAVLPPQTAFFQLQMDETKVLKEAMDPRVKSELDLSFAKIERTVMDLIAQSDDRVVIHQALKHLVVGGNALIFMDKDKLKLYPLNRYVVDRDGAGNVIEIVTKEQVSRDLIPGIDQIEPQLNDEGMVDTKRKDVDIYTHVKREKGTVRWYQEVYGKVLPNSNSASPVKTQPWLCLRFNVCDNEAYGRGRAEEFLGDLKSLEALSQALVEGSAAAAKVVFTVSPSSTTKPATLAQAGNGAIVMGRPDDIGVVTTGGKTADFSTALQMVQGLEKRISEAFLILQVRDSERTTAEEVRSSQLELDSQLGGLFSLLTVDFLVPYLNRKLDQAQKKGDIPKLPKGIVRPVIIAGVNAIGRGFDRDTLVQFMTTIAQTLGPEAIGEFINNDELIKRLAAAQGIDVLNLIKSMDERQQQQAQADETQRQLELTKQAAQMQRNNIELQNGQQAQNPQNSPQNAGGV